MLRSLVGSEMCIRDRLIDDNGRFDVDEKFNLIKAKSTNYEAQVKHIIKALIKDNGNPSLSVSISAL